MTAQHARPASPLRVALEALPLGAALAGTLFWVAARHSTTAEAAETPEPVKLESVRAESADSLRGLFARYDYEWPPAEEVPALALRHLPNDLNTEPVDEKKALFFRALLPLVLAENDRVQRQRERLLEAFRTPELRADGEQAPFVEKLMAANDLEGDINDPELRSKLLRRVDTVPPALALAQAANESGWGSSRFAKEANNLFGEWTWNARHGIAPRDRPEGRRYFVRVFPTLRDSVKSYVNNLNTNPAYIELRALRADARDAGIRPTAKRLAAGLKRYSSRGKEYVAEIRAMIRHNELQGIAANAALASPTALASAE